VGGGRLERGCFAGEAAALAGAITTTAALSAWLLEISRRRVVSERAWVHASLDLPGRRVAVGDDGARDEPTLDLRPGELVSVAPGEDVPVDLTITEGDVEILPWLGATTPVRRGKGDAVVAGARLLQGRLVGTCTWTGNDRTFARLVLDPRRRADALAPAAHAPRSLAERWAAVTATGAALLTYVISRSPLDAAMTLVAVQAGLSTPTIASLASVHVARGVLLAQRRGIGYRSADAWDRAARATVALFCARGTLLLGEPEVAEVEPLAQNIEAVELLALSAGAARAESTPTANALLRAAKSREVKPDAVRNPTALSGLGVIAVTSAGEDLCVGSRTLLIEQKISIATAEWRMGELEAMGRSIVLVALSGRLVGIVALQDGIRPGARSAVQHLLDAHIEPVLMSGDSRETCEAIARSLDIEHIRPEVAPGATADEVKRVAETGGSVAVFGHTGLDDAALGAANVAVALGAAGSAQAEQEVALASDDLRDAALSLALARRTRIEARVGFGLAAIPPTLGTLIVALGVLPPAFVPLAALIGGAMGVLHGRAASRQG
jgi:cation transport ATPase